jgi:hypothetical protein
VTMVLELAGLVAIYLLRHKQARRPLLLLAWLLAFGGILIVAEGRAHIIVEREVAGF